MKVPVPESFIVPWAPGACYTNNLIAIQFKLHSYKCRHKLNDRFSWKSISKLMFHCLYILDLI